MAYICTKPAGSCPTCEHYRPDPDEPGRMACWAQYDADHPKPETPNQHPCAGCERYMVCEECQKSVWEKGKVACAVGSRKGSHRYCFLCRKDSVCKRLHDTLEKRRARW